MKTFLARLGGKTGPVMGFAPLAMLVSAAAQANGQQLTSTVPEPATLALLSIGAAGVAMFRRRK